MPTSKVYFCDLRAKTESDNLLNKLRRLVRTAGFDTIDFENKFSAIKIHFGESGNLSFLRPNYAKTIVDMIKEKGGKPFLTDCATLYVGRRKNALDHIEAAYENGFSPFSTGCHIIIADGLKGNDDIEVPLNGEYVQSAKIGRAIMDADVFITLNHFKGHEATGFGGAIKNIGMGSGSRAGKMEMHSDGKVSVHTDICIGCGKCVKICAHSALRLAGKKCFCDHRLCVGCGRCIAICPVDAIEPDWGASNDALNQKMAEYAKAVLYGRPNFHVSFVMDVSPNCDCHAENDLQIVPNIGIFASFDPVALDQACADAVNAAPIIPGSWLDERKASESGDHFCHAHPTTDWKVCLEHAEKIGLGTREYEKIYVK